jgi:hypothetical protein
MKCHLLPPLALIFILGSLVAALLPLAHRIDGAEGCARVAGCKSNLRQLAALGSIYAKAHQGEWPAATGGKVWLRFRTDSPPLIEAEEADVLHCDVQDHELNAHQTNYRGPRVPWSQLKAGDPIAADAEGNHGEGEPINVLLKDGSVVEAAPGDALWKKCRELLSP